MNPIACPSLGPISHRRIEQLLRTATRITQQSDGNFGPCPPRHLVSVFAVIPDITSVVRARRDLGEPDVASDEADVWMVSMADGVDVEALEGRSQRRRHF